MRKNPYKPTWQDIYEADSIYMKKPNKYGYQIRVNHPEILPYYLAFKELIGEPEHFPISHDERLAFEHLVLHGHYPIKLKRA